MLLKKSLSLFLCACLVLSLCVFALPRTAKATPGDIFYVQSTDPIPVTVTMMVLTDPAGTTPGTAQVGDGTTAGAVIRTATSVTLPDTVTSDGKTYTVTAVGDNAFYNCAALASVNLPKATGIGAEAFYRCDALVSVSLPEATTINSSAFGLCTSLASLNLPKVTTVGEQAFRECTSLADVRLPEATTINNSAFYFCESLVSLSLPKATSIGRQAFFRCNSLANVSLPQVTSIGYQALAGCIALGSVTIWQVTAPTLGEYAFSGTPTTCKIYVPAGATGYDVALGWPSNIIYASSPSVSVHSSAGGADFTFSQYVGTWSGSALTVQADCNKLTSVVVDGVQLTREKDYTVECGSTIITFTQSCLASLKDGTHTLRAQFTDGRYDGSFTTPLSTALTTVPALDVPATGGTPVGGAPLCALALLGLLGAIAVSGCSAQQKRKTR